MIYLIVPLTLLLGTILSFQGEGLALLYAAYYGVCFLILKSYQYGEDFYLTFDQRTTEVPEKKFVLAGQEITSNEHKDKQEDRFLNVFALSRVVKRKILSTLIIFAGMWFFFAKVGVVMSPQTIFPFLVCFAVVNSFYVGHLLVPLALNLAIVIFSFSSDTFIGLYFIYIFLLLFSLSLMRRFELLKVKNHFPAIILYSVLIMGLCYGFSWFLPKQWEFKPNKVELSQQEVRSIKDYLKQGRSDLAKLQMKAPSPDIEALMSQIHQLELLAQKRELSSHERTKLRGGLESVMSSLEDLSSKELSGMRGDGAYASGDGLTVDDQKMLETISQDMAQGIARNEIKGLSDLDKNNLRSLMSSMKDKAAHGEEMKDLENLLARPELSVEEQTQLAEVLKKIETKSKTEVEPHISPKLTAINKETLLRPLKEESETNWQRWKKMLPFFVAVGLFGLLYTLLNKRGVKRIEGVEQSVLEELKEEWKQLRKKKLSPREEVIHYYNLFHESLQKIHYSEHEAPPSCIIYQDMKEFNPELEKATMAITEIFAQCYYGQKNVTSDALKLYRKGISKIIKVYQLK